MRTVVDYDELTGIDDAVGSEVVVLYSRLVYRREARVWKVVGRLGQSGEVLYLVAG